MAATRLILVRHAQSAPSPDTPEEAWPLSPTGREQAEGLIPVLMQLGADVVISSPYLRAVDTVGPYAQARGLPIAIEHDLRERLLTRAWLEDIEDIHEAMRRMHADPDFALPDGETGGQCRARFDAALERIARAHAGRCVALASHGAIISLLLTSLADDLPSEFWHRIRNPHLFHLRFDEGFAWTGETTLGGAPTVRAWAG